MSKKLILLIIIDIVLILLWDYWANSIHIDDMEAVGVILIVPAIIIVSGIVGLILQFKKSVWGRVILINTFMAFAFFIGVFKYENWKQQHDNYLTHYFTDNDKIYSVILKLNKGQLQNGLRYDVYERRGDYGNAGTDLDGRYSASNDTIYLRSKKGKEMKIFGRTLFDYPQKGDVVALRKEP